MTTSFSLRTLSRADILENLSPLSDILADCVTAVPPSVLCCLFVANGANVLAAHRRKRGGRGASRAGGRTCRADVGTVQLVIDQPENQPHRADVAKLLVHQNARRQGLANALMNYLEQLAREQGKSVLVLDTATGSGAERFYVQCGWEKAGEIPRYALMPDGTMTATSLFYKILQ